MASAALVVLAALVAMAHGHGMLLRPVSRAVRLSTGLQKDGMDHVGSCAGETCMWYTQRAHLPAGGKVTNCDERLRTMGVSCDSKPPGPVDWPCTDGEAVPWCSPGAAPVKSPCGVFSGGYDFNGRDMLELDGTPQAKWVAGGVAEVVWNIIANHGGGYAYRLCPHGSDLSEECFQSHTLEFHNDSQQLIGKDGASWGFIPAVRTTNGTTPAGSMWTRNPVPMEGSGPYVPIPGHPTFFGRGPFEFAVQDFVKVPADLTPGDYVLSFRWDSEQVQQVWSQCSDVTIVNPGYRANRNQQAEEDEEVAAVPKHTNICTGNSLSLDTTDCDVWGDIFDNLGGDVWGSPKFRADPCGGISSTNDWSINVVCGAYRNKNHITELYLLGGAVKGAFPQSLAGLSQLGALSIVDSNVTGTIPDNFGELQALEMIWLDHNKLLEGPLPPSLSNLTKLSVLELHYTDWGVTPLPALDYRGITDCTLNGLVFKCPLPAGAETCGATCQ